MSLSSEMRLHLLPSVPPAALVENLLRAGWRFTGDVVRDVNIGVVEDVRSKNVKEIAELLFSDDDGGRIPSFSMIHDTGIGGEFLHYKTSDTLQFSPTINRIKLFEGFSDVSKYVRLICGPLQGLFISWMWDEEAR